MTLATEIVNGYFAALKTGDVSQIPYAEGVELWAPLGPNGLSKPIVGAAAVRAFLSSVAPVIESTEVLNVFERGDWCVGRALIRLIKPRGAVLRVCDVFKVRRGQIVFQENHFDPRPALAG